MSIDSEIYDVFIAYQRSGKTFKIDTSTLKIEEQCTHSTEEQAKELAVYLKNHNPDINCFCFACQKYTDGNFPSTPDIAARSKCFIMVADETFQRKIQNIYCSDNGDIKTWKDSWIYKEIISFYNSHSKNFHSLFRYYCINDLLSDDVSKIVLGCDDSDGNKEIRVNNAQHFDSNVKYDDIYKWIKETTEDIAFKEKMAFRKESVIGLRRLGIDDCASKKYFEESLDKKKCLNNINHSLKFMGIACQKWLFNGENQKIIKNKLKKDISLQFLLVNPTSDHYKEKIYAKRFEYQVNHPECSSKENSPNEVVQNLKAFYEFLKEKELLNRKIEIRYYNHFPNYKIQINDDKEIFFSPYSEEVFLKDEDESYPNLKIVPKCDGIQVDDNNSLFNAVNYLFDMEWKNAKLLTPEILDEWTAILQSNK